MVLRGPKWKMKVWKQATIVEVTSFEQETWTLWLGHCGNGQQRFRENSADLPSHRLCAASMLQFLHYIHFSN